MTWKDNLKRYGLYAGLAGAVFFGYSLRGCDNYELKIPRRQPDDKDLIYEGDIEGRNVNYRENVNIEVDGKTRKANVMIVKKGDDAYTLIGLAGTNIEWKLNTAPNYVNDKLYRVGASRGETSYNFRVEDMNDTHLDGQRARSMLEKGKKYYNNLRTKIREKKRADYAREHDKLEEEFSGQREI